MRTPEYTSNLCYQVRTGPTLQRERVKTLMRAEPVARDGEVSDKPHSGRRTKAVWVLWSALAILAGAGLLYMIARALIG